MEDDPITLFDGPLITHDDATDVANTPGGKSLLHYTNKHVIDGRYCYTGAQFANDTKSNRNTAKARNASVVKGKRGYITIVAKKDMPTDTEVTWTYGRPYWRVEFDACTQLVPAMIVTDNLTDPTAERLTAKYNAPPPQALGTTRNLSAQEIYRREKRSNYEEADRDYELLPEKQKKRFEQLERDQNLSPPEPAPTAHPTPQDEPVSDPSPRAAMAYTVEGGILFVDEIYVSLDHRQERLACSLFRQAIISHNPDRIHLLVRSRAKQQTQARNFFRKLGFRRVPAHHEIHLEGKPIKPKPSQLHLYASAPAVLDKISERTNLQTAGTAMTQRGLLGTLEKEMRKHHSTAMGDRQDLDEIIDKAQHMLLAWPLPAGHTTVSIPCMEHAQFPAHVYAPAAPVVLETHPCIQMIDTLVKAGEELLPMRALADIHAMTDKQLYNILNGKKRNRTVQISRAWSIDAPRHMLRALGTPHKRLRKTYRSVYTTLANVHYGVHYIQIPQQAAAHGDTSDDATPTRTRPTHDDDDDVTSLPPKQKFKLLAKRAVENDESHALANDAPT